MKRIVIAAGALALTAAVTIPVGGAFGDGVHTHCEKYANSNSTAFNLVGDTNSGQSSNVQAYLGAIGANSKCP